MKIYSFPTHGTKERVSGVDFARVIQPSQELAKQKGFEVRIYDPKKRKNRAKDNWLYVGKEYDVIFFNYLNNDWGFAAMGCYNRGNGHKMVIDIDDDLWDVLPDNTAYEVYHKGTKALRDFTLICKEVDAIITTNRYLRNVINFNTGIPLEKIHVIPNYIDLSLYSHVSPFKNDGTINIVHFGSTTHFQSLSNDEFMRGIDMILKDYPNAKFTTIGAFLPQYKERWGLRYESKFGDVDVIKWASEVMPKYMDEADIIVAPLSENLYNRCKSDIKFIESASYKKPFIGQAIRQYKETIEEGKTGYTALWHTDWYNKIKTLIDNTELRKQIGENAYQYVVENRQMKNNVKLYMQLFEDLV